MLGVLVLCWLNLAFTPCAIAFELAEECPQCPPIALQEMADHGHHNAHAMPDCETIQSDCCDLEEAAFDNRGGKLESHDDAPVVAASVIWPSLRAVSVSQHELRPPDPGRHSAPLHKLFCVYLD